MKATDLRLLGIGLGCGLVVGFMTALLVAPKSGEETRKLIKEKVLTASDNAKRFIRKGKEAKE